jgi:hypothetical protein
MICLTNNRKSDYPSGMDNVEPALPDEQPLSAREFVEAYARRGWTQQALATRWRLHRTRLWQIARDPQRPRYWDDAVLSLPRFGRSDARVARLRAQQVSTQRVSAEWPAPRLPTRGHRYRGYLVVGRLLEVLREIGEAAPEGARGLVLGVRQDGPEEQYFVFFETGEGWWFTPDDVDRWLVDLSQQVEELAGYRFTSAAQAALDWRLRRLRFTKASPAEAGARAASRPDSNFNGSSFT